MGSVHTLVGGFDDKKNDTKKNTVTNRTKTPLLCRLENCCSLRLQRAGASQQLFELKQYVSAAFCVVSAYLLLYAGVSVHWV